jgi:hypothetical protein
MTSTGLITEINSNPATSLDNSIHIHSKHNTLNNQHSLETLSAQIDLEEEHQDGDEEEQGEQKDKNDFVTFDELAMLSGVPLSFIQKDILLGSPTENEAGIPLSELRKIMCAYLEENFFDLMDQTESE